MRQMLEEERKQWMAYLLRDQYNYAITITERDSDGVGNVYLSALEWIERITTADPNAKVVIVISASKFAHAHAHGVIKTSLPQRGVRACAQGCWIHTQLLYQAEGWYDYMLRQGASLATLTSEQLEQVRK